MSNNTVYIYQPHFNSSCFRVACKEQQGSKYNFIVVTCSPEYNGVWQYDASLTEHFDKWINGKLPCYQVPINVCTKIKTLDELTNPIVIEAVKKQQTKWWKNEVRNNEHKYVNKPKWMIQ